MPDTNSATDTADRELVFTRLFAAPRELVFEAWSKAESLVKWWGPHGFTTTTHAFDFRPGGAWKYTMHGPDGTDYPNRAVYDEIVRPARIVYSHHGGIDGVPAQFQSTITFDAEGGKTRLTMRMVFRSAAERDAVVEKYGAAEGGLQTLERLAGELEAKPASAGGKVPHIHMTRVFDAPRRLVFEAWTKAEHVARWFAPRPLTMPKCEVDLRAGGVFRFVMRMPDGTEFPFDGTFREVVPNERIVFAGDIHEGNTAVTTVTFAESDGKTTLTVHQTYTFESFATRGAKQGWTATLDQLGEHVATKRE